LRDLNHALAGRLAIVSGRPIEDLDRILGASIPRLAGVHGLERRTGTGRLIMAEPHPKLDSAYLQLAAFAASRPGLRLEFKMLSVALHYRQAPQVATEVLDFARRLAWTTGLKLQEGRMVVELRSPGADKGDSVRAFMKSARFGDATPIYVGDDVTDEDGFVAARDLGGHGVLVGPWRETNADTRLDDVSTVLAWIGAGLETGSFELDVRS
jgi:trehalose 6-phosphate phosphatase